jgi:glycogen(starch) synthase
LSGRICVVTKIWNSGTGWFAAALVDGLADSAASVVFIAPPLQPAFREPTNPNIVRITVPRELIDSPSRFLSKASKLRRIMGTLLAIGLQLFRSKTFLFTMPDHEIISIPIFLMLRLFGKKVILIVHDVIPHDFALVHRKRLTRILIHSQYRAASVIVTLSEAGRQRLISEFQIRAPKIRVIPHGAFGFDRQSKIPGEHVLLAFGSIRKNKNVLKVLDAVKMARASGLHVKLLVAGGYDRSNIYCQECVTIIREDPSAFIDRVGFVDEIEIPDLIKRADAFILAYSDFDSQSGVAVLAGINGRPVIATFAGGVRELKALGLAGVEIQQPVTPTTIVSAIQEFYRTPLGQWQAAAETGRSQLSGHLDWTRVAHSYLCL